MRKIIDRTGEKFGRLTVVKIKRENKCTYYYCKCDCGNELWVRSDCLISGNTKSCGCLNKKNRFKTKNIKGEKFNKLIAIEPTNKRDKNNGSVIWKCKCDCKNIVYVSYGDLVFGKTKSCGCSISEVSKENIKKAYKKNIKNNVVEGTNLAAIGRKELIASNTSGIKGVRWDKSKNKWVAEIQFKKKRYFLGRYKDKEEAIQARKTAEEKLFGKFLKEYNDFLIAEADDAIRTYEMVLSGEKLRFPHHFWKDISDIQLRGLLRYFFQVKLGWDIEDIRNKPREHTIRFLGKYKLSGISNKFNNSYFNIVNFTYPNIVHEWELKYTTEKFWTRKKVIQVIRYIFKQKQWTEEDIKNKTFLELLDRDKSVLTQARLFKMSPFQVINIIYPNKFKSWELKKIKCPKNYWNVETGKQAVKWLIEEKLKWNKNDIEQNLNIAIFKEYGLYAMLYIVFNGSIYNALNITYPGKFKREDFKYYKHFKT